MAMTPDQIRAAVVASDALLAHAHATPPNTQAIATALSAGRTIAGAVDTATFLGWAAATGLRAVIQDQSTAVGSPLRSSALAMLDIIANRTPLDLSDSAMGQANVQMLNAWVQASAITAEQEAQLLALAEQSDPVPEFDVRCALLADDGTLRI